MQTKCNANKYNANKYNETNTMKQIQTNRIRNLHVVLIFLVDIVISNFDIDDYFVGTMDVSFLHQGSDIYIYIWFETHLFVCKT